MLHARDAVTRAEVCAQVHIEVLDDLTIGRCIHLTYEQQERHQFVHEVVGSHPVERACSNLVGKI